MPRFLAVLQFLLPCLFFYCSHGVALDIGLNAPGAEQKFLSEDEAFVLSGSREGNSLTVEFVIAPGYYLYQNRLSFQAENPDATSLGEAVVVQADKRRSPHSQGDEVVYAGRLLIRVPIKTEEKQPGILVGFQGCAEAGLCYPPSQHSLVLADRDVARPVASGGVEAASDGNSYSQTLFADVNRLHSLALFFLGGILLALTPCVLPMLPLVSAILVGSRGTAGRRMLLVCGYVLGMSLTFALVGLLTGLFGAGLNIPARLQSPWVIVPVALLFVLLGLSLCGCYELQLPFFLRSRLSGTEPKSQRQGTLVGAVLAGVFSTLILSPCVSAPLAGALVYISTTGDAWLGGLSLFVLGLGMGAPLLLAGAGGARWLPAAGSWMKTIQLALGILMLGMAVWVLARLLPGPVVLLLWGVICMAGALLLGALPTAAAEGQGFLRQLSGILLLVYGVSLVTGGLRGHSDPLLPLKEEVPRQFGSELSVLRADSAASLEAALRQAADAGLPSLVDVYADWCVQCKLFEQHVLSEPRVLKRLASVAVIRLDVSAGTSDQHQLLQRYQLFGPPSLLFFDQAGQELPALRTQGSISAERLLHDLNQITPGNARGSN